eukprot:UN25917
MPNLTAQLTCSIPVNALRLTCKSLRIKPISCSTYTRGLFQVSICTVQHMPATAHVILILNTYCLFQATLMAQWMKLAFAHGGI